MSAVPKLDPRLEKEFLDLVKQRYNGNLEVAINKAIEYFIMFEKNTDEAQRLIAKISDIRTKIKDLREVNDETSKVIREMNEMKNSTRHGG
ncbi:MAG: hypothetical protein L6Q77_14005 [Bacteroidetes bacterium]|nr:hypothetical protein [Bacteroidota bacterium]